MLWKKSEERKRRKCAWKPYTKWKTQTHSHTSTFIYLHQQKVHIKGTKEWKYEHWPLKRINKTKQISSRLGQGVDDRMEKNDYQICFYYTKAGEQDNMCLRVCVCERRWCESVKNETKTKQRAGKNPTIYKFMAKTLCRSSYAENLFI